MHPVNPQQSRECSVPRTSSGRKSSRSRATSWSHSWNTVWWALLYVRRLMPFSHYILSDPLWPRGTARQAPLSITSSLSLLKFTSIKAVMPSNHLILCHPLLLLLSIFPSIRVFSNDLALCIKWPKYWSFSTRPSNEYSGLTFFQNDWFDLLAVQENLKSPLQHHSSKASILWRSVFFMVQLSHPYMTTGKTIVLIIWIFVGKVMSLLFNTLSLSNLFFQRSIIF